MYSFFKSAIVVSMANGAICLGKGVLALNRPLIYLKAAARQAALNAPLWASLFSSFSIIAGRLTKPMVDQDVEDFVTTLAGCGGAPVRLLFNGPAVCHRLCCPSPDVRRRVSG